MRTTLAFVALLCSTTFADESKEQKALKADMKKLEGTWEGYAVEGKGEDPDKGPVHLQITIKGDKMSAVNLGNANKDMGNGTYKLAQSKTSREMDATGVVLPGKRERSFLGIYELDGNTLKWCVGNRANTRPTEFQTSKGNYLLILKRKK